ncbi:DNA polymerase IV [Pelobium manganitolerans]|uniref:DNA polymerase IV n=2 Tax=Pelobium manganitolerans TaxID=1842495 RepID=A0A419S3F2_9SPHI|nr:DNA polymerase IV [Pelobium manganitolerans]RKD13829.1 DNA polymerase IV [Pelobium manganitolerans]
MQKQIVHIDLDSFFVSVECRKNPDLRGKPVAIGNANGRGVVASCSYEARKFGVHSAMPSRQAQKLCPQLIFVSSNYGDYIQASREVTSIIEDAVPLFEKSSIDEFYIDLSGMEKFFGTLSYAVQLREKIISETHLPISFGLSKNKTISKIATGFAKPNGYKHVELGTEKAFLAPLSVSKIPMIGKKTSEKLQQLGLHTIGDLQKLSKQHLVAKFGKQGEVMYLKANGLDEGVIIPHSDRKSISTEHTFGEDTVDAERLQTVIISMTEELCYKMRKENFVAGCISVKIRYEDFSTFNQQMSISYSAADHLLIKLVKQLFEKLYQKGRAVRLIGVRLSDLVRGHHQIHLFDDSEGQIELYKALDNINNKYGSKTVHRAATASVKIRSHNPFGKE